MLGKFLFRGGPSSLELSWTCRGDPCAFHESAEVVLHGLSDAVSVAAAMDGIPCGSVRRDGRVWRIPVEGKFDRLSVTWDRENLFSA